MTITYPLAVPAAGFTSMNFRMNDNIGVSSSPYSYSDEIFENPGKQWLVDANVRRLSRKDATQWTGGFLAALNGRKGTFLLGDPAGVTPRGVGTGTPLVNGANQTGQSLVIDGCTPSITGWLLKGDYVQIGTGLSSRLHMSMSDVNTDGSGNATLDLWPGFTTAPADNAALILANAVGLFRLSSNERGWSIDNAIQYGINFSAKSIPA